MNSIQLFINKKEYKNFKEIRVNTAIKLGNSFEFASSTRLLDTLDFALFDDVEIVINGVKVLTGFITQISTSYSNGSHSVNIIGFDKTYRVVKSEVSSNTQYSGPISISSLFSKILKDNELDGISIIDLSSAS